MPEAASYIIPTMSTPGVVGNDSLILKWIFTAELEGDAILKGEPAYHEMDKAIGYIMGEQLAKDRPASLSQLSDNRFKHIVLQVVSALTDVHPLFGFKTFNPRFQTQSTILDKLARAWWINTFADLKLADVLRYSSVLGTGYVEIHWDPAAGNGQGDIVLIPRDPREVIPIRPSMDGSVQSWEGAIVRTAMSINELHARYDSKKHLIVPDRSANVFTRAWTRARQAMGQVLTPTALDVLQGGARTRGPISRIPTADVLYCYIKDRSIHKGSEPKVMGDPSTTWSYTVYPEGYEIPTGEKREDGTEVTITSTRKDARLYPNGRYIICTRRIILHDGPSPYWHGKIPLVKMCLDPWPWSFLGAGLGKDLMPLQDSVNAILNGILDNVQKALRPGIVADKKAVPDSQWNRIDTRVAGLRLKTNPAAGKGVQFEPAQDLPVHVFETLKFLISEMDYLPGVANLTALTQLKQAPGADSIERMMEALSPTLRLRGRLLEAFLREVGEMVKANFFQFYNVQRRVAMLGDAGMAFEDFDFEPGALVPAMSSKDKDFTPELSAKLPRSRRAQWHMNNFTFQITPNSLLALSQISRKLLYLQLWRGGLMDPWTLFETLEIPNGGVPPSGAVTITERLAAAQEMGLMPNESSAGRKASGQTSPSLKSKPDASGIPRTTVTESR